MGIQLPLSKRCTAPSFRTMSSGQTARWMNMPLGTERDLSPGHIMLDGDPAPPSERGTAAPLFSAHVYCDHGRPSQLLLSSCTNSLPETLCCARVKVSPHILALLFDLPSVLRDNSLLITEHFQTETENASIGATTNIVRCRCGVSVFLVKFDAVMQEKCPKLYDKYSAVAEMGDRFFPK